MSLFDPHSRSGWRPTRRRMRLLVFLLIGTVIFVLLVGSAASRGHGEVGLEGGREGLAGWVPNVHFPGIFGGKKGGSGGECKDGSGEKYDVWNRTVINSPVTTRFRDALRGGEKYITAFMVAGWTNDVMAAMDLLYLSLLTNRIPIIPPFWPTHVGTDAGLVPFSDFFDVTRWAKALNIPILEFKDVKNFTQETLDPVRYFNPGYYGGEGEGIGCWSIWMTQHARGEGPREGEVPAALTLDVSWTPVRFGHQIDPTAEEYDLLALAKLAEPREREVAITEAKESYLTEMWKTIEEAKEKGDGVYDDPPRKIPLPNRNEEQLDPDDHLLCYDYLYFTSTHERGEFWWGDSPAWNTVGTHLYFSPRVLELSTTLLLKVFALKEGEELPPFVAIHVRRNDFTVWCGDETRDDCLAPLSAYVRRVEEVKKELIARRPELGTGGGVARVEVVVFTDEPRITPEPYAKDDPPLGSSERWWESVESMGWRSVRHDLEATEEKFGKWYPSILDACMMAMGSAFVGTDRSTYSLIAKRRVEDWANGPTRLVKWGSVGADDH